MTTKGVVYYTDNRLDDRLFKIVQKQLARSCNGSQIISVSLAPIDFGENIVLPLKRGVLTMFKQILAGLEQSRADIIFLCEHDVFYHPSHFEFVPSQSDVYYYNENVWKVRTSDGQALFYYAKQTAQLCAYRELLVGHYRRRIAKVERNASDLRARGEPVKRDGFSQHMGFEPGCHSIPRGVDNYRAERWMSEVPNIDIRHSHNLTPSRWSQDLFRNPDACLGWMLADAVPGWGVTKDRFNDFLKDVDDGLFSM